MCLGRLMMTPPPGNEVWDSALIFAGVMVFAIEILKFLTVALSWAVMCPGISFFFFQIGSMLTWLRCHMIFLIMKHSNPG